MRQIRNKEIMLSNICNECQKISETIDRILKMKLAENRAEAIELIKIYYIQALAWNMR